MPSYREEHGTDEPRETVEWSIECYAPDVFFLRDYEEIPVHIRADFEGGMKLPCEGGGRVGPWCIDCEFGEADEA